MWRSRIGLLALTVLAAVLVMSAAMGAVPNRKGPGPAHEAEAGSPPTAGPAVADPAPAPAGGSADTGKPHPSEREEVEVRVVADGLAPLAAIAFAPDGRLFLAERGGAIRALAQGVVSPRPLAVLDVGEAPDAWVTGLTLDPRFPAEPYLYAAYTYDGEDGPVNRVVRLRMEGDVALPDGVVLDDIPGGERNNGGPINFGPDGLLYVGAGDAGRPEEAQNPQSQAGKILRVHADGSVPADNPFPGSAVYSLGHHSPRGFAWQPESGRLYVVEGAEGNEGELNLVEPGANYGWGQDGAAPVAARAPVAAFGPSLAPAGVAFFAGDSVAQWQGHLFVAAVAGQFLSRIELDPDEPRRVISTEALYGGAFGRLREVVQGPDGALYVATANRAVDDAASPRQDRILRIGAAPAEQLLFPNLRTLPPSDLRLSRERVGGVPHSVLRFTNMVWNTGEGRLELAQVSEGSTRVFQNVHDAAGRWQERLAGEFVYHEFHNHWHFEDFARYELWPREEYDRWLASNRAQGAPRWSAAKTSSCLMDNLRLRNLEGAPAEVVYPDRCERRVQGLSVGWADIYEYDLPEQYLDLGQEALPDGRYVLRSVVDPSNLIWESAGGGDVSREGEDDNAGVTAFTLSQGRVVIESPPG